MSKPLGQQTPEKHIARISRDVEMLKRRPVGGGPGDIRFNYYNDAPVSDTLTGFLDVSTHDYIYFLNDGANGIESRNTGNGGNKLTDFGSDSVTSGVFLDSQSRISLDNTGLYGIQIVDENAANTAGILLQANYRTQIINLGSGGIFVRDTDVGGIRLREEEPTATIWLDSLGSILGSTTGGPIIFHANWGTTSNTIQMRVNTGNFFAVTDNTPTVFMEVGSTGTFLFNLPTSNPGVTGQLWNSGGTVKIV